MKWSCLRNRFTNLEAFMSHANVALTPKARLKIARLIRAPVSRSRIAPTARSVNQLYDVYEELVLTC